MSARVSELARLLRSGGQTDGVDGTPLAFRVREKLKEKLLAKEGAQ